nr:MAG TPA: hypothetical protein [Caudoviricetes sp.]
MYILVMRQKIYTEDGELMQTLLMNYIHQDILVNHLVIFYMMLKLITHHYQNIIEQK